MPTPVFSAGGRITPPAQTMLNWLVRNIHQAAANTDALDDPHYGTAIGDFANKVINGGVTFDKYAATEPGRMSYLWSLYQLYGPADIEPQPTKPEPAVPPPDVTAAPQITQESVTMLESKLSELADLANAQEAETMNEPLPLVIVESLIRGSELSVLGMQVVRVLDMLALEGKYPDHPAAQMYYGYCRPGTPALWKRASLTPAAFFREFPHTSRDLLECVRALDVQK